MTEPEKAIDPRCTCWSPDRGHDGDCAVMAEPVIMGESIRPKRPKLRTVRVQVRDQQGRMLDEWFVEVVPSAQDAQDARRAVHSLRDLLMWGPDGSPSPDVAFEAAYGEGIIDLPEEP